MLAVLVKTVLAQGLVHLALEKTSSFTVALLKIVLVETTTMAQAMVARVAKSSLVIAKTSLLMA
jgi:hypothetical protein